MFVGTQYPQRSDDDYRVLSQLGVTHINGYPPGNPSNWNYDVLSQYREKIENFGLSLDMIALPMGTTPNDGQSPNIMLGISPERDKEIEVCINIIRACEQAGIPAVKYRLFLIGILRTKPHVGRGGSIRSSFYWNEVGPEGGSNEWGDVSEEEYWERITYFLDATVPQANSSKIKLACHPHDPYTPPGYKGVTRVLGTVDGMKRFIKINESPYHGLNFCQGTVSEMLENPAEEIYDIIEWFGKRKKIFNVHFRNIQGKKLAFEETFPDEGVVDMVKCAKLYKDVGYTGMLMPDHSPKISGENQSTVSFAFCYGYIRGILQSINALND